MLVAPAHCNYTGVPKVKLGEGTMVSSVTDAVTLALKGHVTQLPRSTALFMHRETAERDYFKGI